MGNYIYQTCLISTCLYKIWALQSDRVAGVTFIYIVCRDAKWAQEISEEQKVGGEIFSYVMPGYAHEKFRLDHMLIEM